MNGLKLTAIKHEPALDGLRAFAVLAVVLTHGSPHFPGGGIGVDIFFVLSGFLITRILAVQIYESDHVHFKNFYIRRVLRLAPALALVLLAEVLFAAFFVPKPQEHFRAAFISATYLMNWNRAFDWVPQGYLGHTWSLAVEEQFYLIWPLMLTLIIRRRPVEWLLVIAVVILGWRAYLSVNGASVGRVYNGFDTHSDVLFVGCAIGLLSLRGKLYLGGAAAVSIAIAALCYIIIFYNDNVWFRVLTPTVGAVSTCILVAHGLENGTLNRVLSTPIAVYTGKISYGWYLWHFPVLLAGRDYFGNRTGFGLLLVALAYPIASLSYHFVEQPFLRLKSRFA